MLYFLTIAIFLLALFAMVFARDGYINSELDAYQITLKHPYIPRLAALQA